MKKTIKRAAAAVIALVTALCFSIQANAEAIYVVNGYAYSILTNSTISLCGWEGDSPDVVVPDKIVNRDVVSIGTRAFKNNAEITSVNLSQAKHLKTIEMEAFYGSTGLTQFDIPYTVTAMGDSIFQNCTSLQTVNIHANTSQIPENCFYNCTSLTSVSIPPYVNTIRKFAFAKCTALEYIEIPSTVTSIAASAFRDDNVTIGCYYSSYAYQFAVDNNIPYTLLDGVKLGDVNNDGAVNINDVTAIQRYLAHSIELKGIFIKAADANCDGDVNIIDATTVQKYLAHVQLVYPIGENMTQ